MSNTSIEFKNGRYDSKVNSYDEYLRAVKFVGHGTVMETRNNSIAELTAQLAGIGYVSENHKNYTFHLKTAEDGHGNDYRQIFIVELGQYFFYI